MNQITNAESLNSLRKIFECEDAVSLVAETGYRVPLFTMEMKDKDGLCDVLKIYYTIIKALPEVDQFCSGLESLGVLSALAEYPLLMKKLFVPLDKVTINKGENINHHSNMIIFILFFIVLHAFDFLT